MIFKKIVMKKVEIQHITGVKKIFLRYQVKLVKIIFIKLNNNVLLCNLEKFTLEHIKRINWYKSNDQNKN